MVIFCSAEWPSFNVGWPPKGTFDLKTVRRVREIILRPQSRHPDQVPYILVWEDLIVSPTPWIQPFCPPQAAAATRFLVAEEKKQPPATPPAPPSPCFTGRFDSPSPYHTSSILPPSSYSAQTPTPPTFPRSGWGRTCNEHPKP